MKSLVIILENYKKKIMEILRNITCKGVLDYTRCNILILLYPFVQFLFEYVNKDRLFTANLILHLLIHLSVTTLLMLYINWLVSLIPVIGRFLSAILQSILIFPFWLALYVIFSGIKFNQDTVIAICQTSLSEAWFYITSFPLALVMLLIMFGLMIAFGIICTGRTYCKKKKAYIIIIILCGIFLSPSAVITYKDYSGGYYGLGRLVLRGKDYYNANKRFIEIIKKMHDNEHLEIYKNKGNNARIAIIIGESHSRHHMNAKNSPFYFSIKNKKLSDNFICFDRAYTCFPHTMTSLSMVLTNKNQYEKMSYDRNTVFNNAIPLSLFFKTANYKCRWLGNQEISSAFASFLKVTSSFCEDNFFVQDLFYTVGEYMEYGFDELMIPKIKMTVSPRSVTFIHLRGNHWPYMVPSKSVPDNFNTYEKTLFYVDKTLEQMFDTMIAGKYDIIVYVPDHGEIPYKGHASTDWACRDITWIPMLVYMSSDYAEKNNGILERVKNASKLPFTNDLLWNLLSGILEINGPDMPQTLNPLNENYLLRSENDAKTNYGETIVGNALQKDGISLNIKTNLSM